MVLQIADNQWNSDDINFVVMSINTVAALGWASSVGC